MEFKTKQNTQISLYLQDHIEGTKIHVADNSADLVVADTPYNLKFGGTSHTRDKKPRFSVIANDALSESGYRNFTHQWLRQGYRILKPGRHIYVFIDWRQYPDVAQAVRAAGFIIKNCIVWDKVNIGMGWQYRFQHEFIIFAVKPDKRVRRIEPRRSSDVWKIPRIPGVKTIHPTE